MSPRTTAGKALSDLASELWWQPNRLAGANAMQSATRDVRQAIETIELECSISADQLATAIAYAEWPPSIYPRGYRDPRWLMAFAEAILDALHHE